MARQDRTLFVVLIVSLLGMTALVTLWSPPGGAVAGLLRDFVAVQLHPARLLNDFTLAASPAAAFLNAMLVAGTGLLLVRVSGIRVSGPTVAAVFTLFGFGLFGKTVWNVLPIYAGVAIAARIAGKQFRDYILIALFGTALGPLVTLVAFEFALPPALGVPAGIAAGVAVGAVLPAVAMTMLRLHQGYSLYNMGLTTGFVALIAAAVAFGSGNRVAVTPLWNAEPTTAMVAVVPALAVVLVATAFALGGRNVVRSWLKLLRLPGRLPSDFMDMISVPAALLNMGIMGLLAWGYTVLVGADLNGPVLGGIFTVIGFAAFGKHPGNCWPILVGIVAAALVFGHGLAEPAVILAALFGTTLAPLAGEFGVLFGVGAGVIHLLVVLRSGAWHAGIGLYNNGLAGGLTAAFLVSLLDWYRANEREAPRSRPGSFSAAPPPSSTRSAAATPSSRGES